MTDTKKKWQEETAKALCDAELDRLLREYGAIRVAKRIEKSSAGDVLLLISPPIVAQLSPPVIPATLLNDSLFRLLEVAYGDIRTAAREAGASAMS